MSTKNILQRHMTDIHIHCEGDEATIDDGTAKGVIHCDTIEEKNHCDTNEEETATNSPAPPVCTVATSWPVTKWKLCKKFVCWLEQGQVVLELLEMVEGGGAELFGPDSWLLSKHLNFQ